MAQVWLNCSGFDPVKVGLQPIFLGRSKECQLQLPHESVSRRHAMIGRVGTGMFVEVKSAQGLALNRDSFEKGSHKLVVGDQITIGPYVIRVDGAPEKTDDEEATIPISLSDVASSSKLGEVARERDKLKRALMASQRKIAQIETHLRSGRGPDQRKTRPSDRPTRRGPPPPKPPARRRPPPKPS